METQKLCKQILITINILVSNFQGKRSNSSHNSRYLAQWYKADLDYRTYENGTKFRSFGVQLLFFLIKYAYIRACIMYMLSFKKNNQRNTLFVCLRRVLAIPLKLLWVLQESLSSAWGTHAPELGVNHFLVFLYSFTTCIWIVFNFVCFGAYICMFVCFWTWHLYICMFGGFILMELFFWESLFLIIMFVWFILVAMYRWSSSIFTAFFCWQLLVFSQGFFLF